ncbi:MAG TPA: amidohydrolase family protein [Thermoanaerobaculia bacterium]
MTGKHLAGVLCITLVILPAAVIGQDDETPHWGRFFERLRTDQLMQKLSEESNPEDVAFVGAEVIPMTEGTSVLHDQTVVVRNGRIDVVGPRTKTNIPAGVRRIDARGKFLFPGLTDVHVHTVQTHADYLLDLLHGVTTVREMDGYPWLLKVRAAIRANRLLAPTTYVTGTILNGAPMGWYAIVIKTPEQARSVVREQKAAGYDYIKVHNVMPLPLYDAIAETARQEHIRFVGHIPHEVSVKHAIEEGQYTFEHFKGFYLDRTLTMSPEDWLDEVKGADVWIAPTLTNRRGGMTVDETRAFMATPDAQLVSARARAEWPEGVTGHDADASRTVWTLSQEIFKKLLPVTQRFIAGTDSGGGYPNSIRGFALHDELETMESLGMPVAEVLRTATVNAAIALGDPASFGSIEVGKRADLLLLDKNPLLTSRNLRDPRDVMVRGIWLDHARLAHVREAIVAIYAKAGADRTLDHPSATQIEGLVAGMDALRAKGWIFNDHHVEELTGMLRAVKRDADADTIAMLSRR